MSDWVIDNIAKINGLRPEEKFKEIFKGLGSFKNCKPYEIKLKKDT